MKRADHRLVGANRFAVGTVAQPVDDAPDGGSLALGREPQCRKSTAERFLGWRAGLIARQLTTKLASSALDLTQAPRAGRSAARQPPRQLLVGIGRLPAGRSVSRDRPAVARTAPQLRHALAHDEPGVLHTFEMNPHPTGVKRQLGGQLIGARRPSEAKETGEQPSPSRLGQSVVQTVAG